MTPKSRSAPSLPETDRDLGAAQICLGSGPDADGHLRRALGLCQQLGDRAGQAHALLYLGRMFEEVQARPREGLHYVLQALELFQVAGHKAGQANAISNAGWCHSVLGEHEEALACYQQALVLHRETDNRDGECCTWDNLGNTYDRLGRHDQAITCYQHSARLFRELGNRPDLAAALTHLGDTLHAAGRGRVFHAYSTYARGIDMMNGVYQFLDLVPKGRDEPADGDPQFWVRRHDEYGS